VKGLAFVVAACACFVTTAATPASGGGRGGDARWAHAIVLKRADLRAFDASAPSSGKTCLPSRLADQTAFARSRQFTSGAQTVASRAWIFPHEAHARTAFRKLVALDYAGCVARQGVVGARILVASQELFGTRTRGDSFRGIRVKIHLGQGRLRFDVFVDIVFVRRGRALADIAFTSPNTPFGEAAEVATLGRMSARMAKPPA
jgi:hypothetical protein